MFMGMADLPSDICLVTCDSVKPVLIIRYICLRPNLFYKKRYGNGSTLLYGFGAEGPSQRTPTVAGNVVTNRCLTLNMVGEMVLWLCLSLPTANSATHSLKYFYTALPQSTGLPEFSAVAYLDEEPIYFYDSSSKEVVSRQEWVKGAVDPDFWRRNTQILMATEKVFKVNMDTARDRFNQTSAHALQIMYSCDWDEVTGATEGREQHGYGGEDFLIFDLKNERWIAPVRQGLPTKIKWDANVPQLKAKMHYLTHTCIECLKKYVSYQRRMLQRTVSPQVTLLQKEPSNTVTCHATGFYPNAIMIFWGRDGVEIHDVVHEETRSNRDGTYQKRTHLTVSPEDLQKHKYSCTVQHSGVDVVLSANRDSIRSNSRNTQAPIDEMGKTTRHYIITMVILVILVILVMVISVIVFIMAKVCKGKVLLEPTAGKEKHCPSGVEVMVKCLPEKNVLLLNNGSNRSRTISSNSSTSSNDSDDSTTALVK